MTRDYLYVADGVLAYLQLAEAIFEDPTLGGEAFNFSTESPLSVLQLVEMLQAATGTELEPDIRATAHHEILTSIYLLRRPAGCWVGNPVTPCTRRSPRPLTGTGALCLSGTQQDPDDCRVYGAYQPPRAHAWPLLGRSAV